MKRYDKLTALFGFGFGCMVYVLARPFAMIAVASWAALKLAVETPRSRRDRRDRRDRKGM